MAAQLAQEQHNEDALCCPITFIPFTNPVIIPECGHTFDRDALVQYKKRECPTCRTRYSETPSKLPTNWAIVSFLDLDIKAKPNSPIKYSAKQAKKDKKIYIRANADIMKNNILKVVMDTGKQGGNRLTIEFKKYTRGMNENYSTINQEDIHNRIIKILKKEGYNVKHVWIMKGNNHILNKKKIIISW